MAMNEKQRNMSVWYLWIAVVGLLLLQSLVAGMREEPLPYSDFKTLIHAQKVSDLVIEERRILGTLDTTGLGTLLSKERVEILKKPGRARPPFVTTRVDDPSLVAELDSRIVRRRVAATAHRARGGRSCSLLFL
jgi:hypothetical protein